MPRRLRREEYTVGWVCALPVELAAAQEMLDEEHDTPKYNANDTNLYTCGRVGDHNVVIACLPEGQMGTSSAATVAVQMKSTFPSTRFGLMVGIGGGVPSEEADVRLGDVVVSKPHKTHGGVVQYDFGKATTSGFERTGALNTPPTVLLNAVTKVRASQMRGKGRLAEFLSKLDNLPYFSRESAGSDILFDAECEHARRAATCSKCSTEPIVAREARRQEVVVHHGTIASGNKVIKDAVERNRLSAELGGVLCFEMEAAGLMNSFPCLVVRGICDYADSHKNKQWQAYAAGTAAAYTKELLSVIPVAEVMEICPAEDVMNGTSKRCLQSPSPSRTSHKRRKPGSSSSTENGFAEQRTVTLPIHQQDRTQVSLGNEQRQVLLKSLRFEQIDARQMTVKTAHARTCKWLLKHDQYLQWDDASKLVKHHGVLWIKGKAGIGKSTLMKFALVNARKVMKHRLVLSFFFNARGEDMERSTTGTYRSLLLRLLERLPALHSVFDSLGLPTSNFSADHQWNVELLKTLLEHAIRSLGDSSVVCFIDALDECDEEQVRDMIQYFEHIGDLAVSNGIRFQVCFSSRHYPHITMRSGLELVLEGQEGHSQDITNYIETELKIGKSKIARQVRAELQEKASGIFMWVVLVVGILNTESDHGNVHTLRQKLREIPGDLHELFRDILTRDTRDKDKLLLCIQWVLFAKQPLSPKQLYHAIFSGTSPEAVAEWDPEDITDDVVKRFILSSSKGLAEITMSKEPKVQFIHESVRDFLLKEDGLGKIWPEFKSNFKGKSHEHLKQCCLDYISIDVAVPLEIPDGLSKASPWQAASLRKSFPFLEYAVQNVLYHSETAEGEGISQAIFLNSFPLPRWVKLDNLFEKHKVRRHTEQVTLLYLLAELNLVNLMGVLGSIHQCLDIENERYGCPLFAAAAMSSEETLKMCMDSIEVQRSDSSSSATALDNHWTQHKSAQRTPRRDFVYSRSKELSLNAAELGHDEVLMVLSSSGRLKTDLKDSKGRTVLWWATKNRCERTLRSLLDANPAMINCKDKDNQTPLYIAAEQGNKAVVIELLSKGADLNAQGGRYGNALQAASLRGYKEIVLLLIDKGASVDIQGGYYGNALQAALSRGYKEIVLLLIDKGVDINAQGGFYGNALQAALSEGHKEIAMLLTDMGADINAQGGLFGNALQVASLRGYKEIVMLLIDKGAEINAQGGHFGSALQAALSTGHKEIAMLLIDKGADINAQGGHFGSALQAALSTGHKEIAMLLIDKGADINAQGGVYGSALQAASFNGYKEIAMLLIDKGADIDVQGGLYGNPLQAASSRGHEEIVTLLEKAGAVRNS